MKPQILINMLGEEEQDFFNESQVLVEGFGRKLRGYVEHVWINDIKLLIEFCNHFRNYPRHFHLNFRTTFSAEENSQISHKIAMFPGIKMSEKDHDFAKSQLDAYIDPSVAKNHGGYSPVIIANNFNLRSKINVLEGKINEVAFSELVATCDTIKLFIRQGAELVYPETIGFNREGASLGLLKSNLLAPPVQLDESMVRNDNRDTYLSYYPAGIPCFKGLNSISSFARMRDSFVATRSPLWILEKNWIEKLKTMGCRPRTIPVMEAGTQLRKNYIDMLVSIKEIVGILPDFRLSIADL